MEDYKQFLQFMFIFWIFVLMIFGMIHLLQKVSDWSDIYPERWKTKKGNDLSER